MEQLNRYYQRSKISGRKFLRVLRHFALDLTASDAAHLTKLSRRSVTSIFLKIREHIAQECEHASPFSKCEVEVDESYFGARRVRGKRGRGASGKTIVFGIFKRNGSVYTEIVSDCKKATLQPLFAVAWPLKLSSTVMAGGGMTALLMLDTVNTSESIMVRMSSSEARHTLMASKASGAMPSAGFRSSMELLIAPSTCI
jgi:transposase